MKFIVAFVLGCAVAGIGSYVAGFEHGKAAMDNVCGNLLNGLSANLRAETIPVLIAAAKTMTRPEDQDTRNRIVRYIHIQARALKDCSPSRDCQLSQPLPSPEALAEALSFK